MTLNPAAEHRFTSGALLHNVLATVEGEAPCLLIHR
jgi:hypothetical protein